MKDRIVQHANRYKLTPVSGDIYDLTPEPGVVTEAGTDLSKATLLSDATVSLLESAVGGTLTEDTVNHALSAIGGVIGKNGVQIAAGSYVGSGAYGTSNPVVLTFDFEPKAVIVSHGTYRGAIFVLVNGLNSQGITSSASSASSSYSCSVSWSANSVSWNNETNAENQLSFSGYTYYYWAIG